MRFRTELLPDSWVLQRALRTFGEELEAKVTA